MLAGVDGGVVSDWALANSGVTMRSPTAAGNNANAIKRFIALL